MGKRVRVILVHAMWLVAGIVLGATISLLWVKGLQPDWVGATGTWFGGVATVLALLWAVQTFRADQAHREREQQQRQEELEESRRQEELDRLEEASRVSVSLRGGSGFGINEDQKMDSVQVTVDNDTDHTVLVRKIHLDEQLVLPGRQTLASFRVQPHKTWSQTIAIEPVAARPGELSGGELRRFGAHFTYDMDGRTWQGTTSSGGPSEVQ